MTTNHAVNASFIPPKTSSIILTTKEKEMLQDAQQEGLKRGITLLSTLTYDWEALAWQAVGSAVNIANSQAFSSDSPESTSAKERASTSGDEVAFSAIQTLLSKVWSKVEAKIKQLKKTNKEIIVQSGFKKNELYEFLSLPLTRGIS